MTKTTQIDNGQEGTLASKGGNGSGSSNERLQVRLREREKERENQICVEERGRIKKIKKNF